MEWKSVGEIASAILILGSTSFMIHRWVKERKAKKAGLQQNPKRCIDEANRITALEIGNARIGVEVSAIKEDVTEVKADVKTLLGLHLKR